MENNIWSSTVNSALSPVKHWSKKAFKILSWITLLLNTKFLITL